MFFNIWSSWELLCWSPVEIPNVFLFILSGLNITWTRGSLVHGEMHLSENRVSPNLMASPPSLIIVVLFDIPLLLGTCKIVLKWLVLAEYQDNLINKTMILTWRCSHQGFPNMDNIKVWHIQKQKHEHLTSDFQRSKPTPACLCLG